MSSDTSELTFIRCPSCRSLVPAASRRCRMCGFSLAPQETSEEAEMEERRAARVRQRTTSTEDPALAASVAQARQDFPAAFQHSESISNGRFEEPAPAVSAQEANPLEDYLTTEDEPDELAPYPQSEPDFQEVPSRADEPVAAQQNVATPAQESPDYFGSEVPQRRPGPFRIGGDREKSSPLSRPEPRQEPNGAAHGWQQGIESGPEVQSAPAADLPAAQQSQKMVSGASFTHAPSQQYVESPSHQEKPMETPTTSEVNKTPAVAERPARQPEQTAQTTRAPRDEFERPRSEPAQRQAESPRQRTSQAAAVESLPRSGRIFGWFVSYDSPDGKSHDIREGKYFLSSSKIKDTDFVVSHPSVSTPHAMLAVTPKGFLVQDLMSEKGVFLKKRGTSEWVREEEVVRVEHGDWLRFGDVEYLVCLVAYPGAK